MNYEYLPKQTIDQRGAKTVWVRCGNKEKARATVMLLADWEGNKLDTFLVFKCLPSTITTKRVENDALRHGFNPTMWNREFSPLQKRLSCRIYGNKCAWWNSELSVRFLQFHFAERANLDENILLIWDDFSGHWTDESRNTRHRLTLSFSKSHRDTLMSANRQTYHGISLLKLGYAHCGFAVYETSL